MFLILLIQLKKLNYKYIGIVVEQGIMLQNIISIN